jgi:hypothetical protein
VPKYVGEKTSPSTNCVETSRYPQVEDWN